MPISTTWVNPSAGGALDLATGSVLTEAWCDGVASDLLRLGGVGGAVTQTVFTTFSGAISTASGSFVTTTDSVSLTTTGGDVLVFALASVQVTVAGNNVGLALQQDAAGYNEVASAFAPVAGYGFMLAGFWKFGAPSAAAHTYNTGWRVSAGAGTMSNSTASRAILAVELKR